MAGLGVKKWSPLLLVSPFGVREMSFGKNVSTAPTNLRLQRFIQNSVTLFSWVQWPLFKGGNFPREFKNYFWKKLRFSRGKKFRNKKSTRNSKTLWKSRGILTPLVAFLKNKLSARDESENLIYIMTNILPKSSSICNKKISTSFLKKFWKILVERCRKEDITWIITHNNYIIII